MNGRLTLYARSIRNTLFRGTGSPGAYTQAQIDMCNAIRDYWLSVGGLRYIDIAALCGNVDRETSFDAHIYGDHGEAYGISQWHQARRDMIEQHKGIKIIGADLKAQLDAWHWEMSESPSWYRHVLPNMLKAPTLLDKITVLIVQYEQSGSQQRDINRQLAMANYWLGQWKVETT